MVTIDDEEKLVYAGSSPLAIPEHPLRRELAVADMIGGDMDGK